MKISAVAARIRSEDRPVRFVVSRLLKRTRLCNLLVIRRDGYALHFYPTSLSAALWADPKERGVDEMVLAAVLRGGDLFLDVGANVGSLTLKAASLVGPTGYVHSFEANPRTCGYLEANIRLNRVERSVCVHRCALGEVSGVIQFALGRSDDMDHVVDTGGIKVQIRRLDQELHDTKRIALLKVDVEGYEVPVLRGASALLGRTEAVYVESYERQLRRYGYCTQDLLDLLTNHGFTVYRHGDGGWAKVPDDHVSGVCENLLALAAGVSPRELHLVT